MKKLLKSTLLVLALLVICSAAYGSPALTPRNFKLAHEESPSGPQHVYATGFAKYLSELSNGVYTCTVYTVGQLGDTVSCVEQCQVGGLDIAFNGGGTLGALVNYFNIFGLDYVLPAELKDVESLLTNSAGVNLLRDIARQYNLEMLDWIHEGVMYWSTNKIIRTPQDFAGVKFRAVGNPIMMGIFSAYGASPTPVAYTETYSALQLKMVDAQTNPLSCIRDMKFYEVQDYLIAPKAEYLTYGMAMNTGVWNSLPPEGQEIFNEACAKARADFYEHFYDYEKSLETFMKDEGLTFIELTDEEIAVFKNLSTSVHQVFIDSCPDKELARKLLDQVIEDCAAYDK